MLRTTASALEKHEDTLPVMPQESLSPSNFSETVSLLRDFFFARGYLEVHTQDRLSILAACEDPTTIASYEYGGEKWPLPQTGQMWLEWELLTQRRLPGVFCVSTSYRQEPNPDPSRHRTIFPMFEFESHGGFEELLRLEKELCVYLGFPVPVRLDYEKSAKVLGTKIIESEHEKALGAKHGPAISLERFPFHSNPFWNMKKDGDKASKIDVLLHGVETIGSAERSCNPQEMRELFHTISDGEYAGILFRGFGKERVTRELESFLALDFFPRFGGGIGVHRLSHALALQSLV